MFDAGDIQAIVACVVEEDTLKAAVNSKDNPGEAFCLFKDGHVLYSSKDMNSDEKLLRKSIERKGEIVERNNYIALATELDGQKIDLVLTNDKLTFKEQKKALGVAVIVSGLFLIVTSILSLIWLSLKFYGDIMGIVAHFKPTYYNGNVDELVYINEKITQVIDEKNYSEIELNEKRQQIVSLQSAMLQMQINPHFLFNTLNLISVIVTNTVKKSNNVERVIVLLSDLLSIALDTKNYIVPVIEEIDYVQKYIEIEKIKYNDSFDVEYDIDDPAITPYLKLVIDESDSRKVYVHAINAETSNNVYTILAKVQGISGEYTGTCKVTITVPIKSIRILPATVGTSITGRVLNLNCDTYANDYFELKTSFTPTNTTESKVILWSVADSNIVTDYNQTGMFKIVKEGSTTITATSSNSSIKDTITVNISATLKKLTLSGVANKKINSSLENNTDLLKLTREPAIDNDEIEFTSSNSEIATVNSNGLVTFLAPGSATITARSKEKTSVYSTFTYTIQMLMDSISFSSSSNGKHINKGEVYQNPVKYAPTNTSFASYIKYTSSNPSVATVDSRGKVTAVGAGSATITATVAGTYTSTGNQLSTSYQIYVDVPLTDVDVITEKTMTRGSSFEFTVKPIPEDTTELIYVTWESLNNDIVSIDTDTGKATAKKMGETTIVAHITRVSTGETFEREIEVEVVNYLKGDLDLNGIVDSADAAIALNLFKYNTATEMDLAIGDMDENNMLDSADAAMILNTFKYGIN